jgi:hypothetical protein
VYRVSIRLVHGLPCASTSMSFAKLFKPKKLIPISLNLLAIGSSTFYLQSKIAYNLEEQEARLDEIEGTLRYVVRVYIRTRVIILTHQLLSQRSYWVD